jgi:hypothetical protein
MITVKIKMKNIFPYPDGNSAGDLDSFCARIDYFPED